MIRTSIFVALFVLKASTAVAQTNSANLAAPNLDPGSSGGTAGMISGGGTNSSNFDGRDPRPNPDARTTNTRKQTSQAKADGDARDENASAKTRAKTARAEADNEDSGKSRRVKKKKKQPGFFSYPYVYGFGAFGSRYMRSRD